MSDYRGLRIIIPIFLILFVFACKKDDQPASCEELGNCPAEFDYLNYAVAESQVTAEANIVYASYHSDNLVDIYEVPENEDQARPLILLSPGGGFKYHNRIPELVKLAKDLARRGYVVGIVKYGVKSNLDQSDSEAVQRMWLEGTIDQRTAIRFFKSNATNYRIDPDKVFIGGWSNGGQLALTAASFQESELATIEDDAIRTSVTAIVDEMGGMEGADHTGVSSSVRGALLLNIYSFDLNLHDANDPAMMFIHHVDSRISSFPDIKTIGTFTMGNNTFYGPQPITEKAKTVGYTMGADLDFIAMEGNGYMTSLGLTNPEPNYAALSSANFSKIADFFHRNIQ